MGCLLVRACVPTYILPLGSGMYWCRVLVPCGDFLMVGWCSCFRGYLVYYRNTNLHWSSVASTLRVSMKFNTKNIAGGLAFGAVWCFLGKVASCYVFPDVSTSYTGQFSWILCTGAGIYLLAAAVEKVVISQWDKWKHLQKTRE